MSRRTVWMAVFVVVVGVVGCKSSPPGFCGDEVVDPEDGEECEGEATTCAALGLPGGDTAVPCNTCVFDSSPCVEAAGTATIEITLNREPLEGALVAVADASGANLSDHATDANGQVTVPVGADHKITAAYTRANGSRDVRTVEGVQPANVIRINFTDVPTSPPTTVGSLVTTFPTPLAGGTTHVTTDGCSSITDGVTSTVPNNLSVFSTCTDANGNAERLAEIFDGQGTLLGYHYLADQPVDVDTPTQTPVDAWNTSLSSITCQLDDVPAGVGDITIDWNADLGILHLTPFADLITAPTAGSTVTRTTEVPDDPAVSSVGCTISFEDDRQCSGVSAPPGTFTFSGTEITKPIFNLTIDDTASPRPTISWSEGADGAVADLTLIRLQFTRDSTFQSWTVISPGTTTSVTLPELPDNGGWVLYVIDDQELGGSGVVSKSAINEITSYEQVKEEVNQTPSGDVCSSVSFGS